MRWTSNTAWALDGIVLQEGQNSLMVQGVNAEGDVVMSRQFSATKTTNAPPRLVLEAAPQSLNVSLAQALVLDASDSQDPGGGALTFVWSVEPETDATFIEQNDSLASVVFKRPGIYTVRVTASDAEGAETMVSREISVFAEGDFANFNSESVLPASLEALRATEEQAGPYVSSYSLESRSGQLTLSIPGGAQAPLSGANASFPLVQRGLPASGDFVIQTDLRLEGIQLGNFFAGLLVEFSQAGNTQRYAYGLENGTALAVKRGSSSFTQLRSRSYGSGQATIRIRRMGDTLSFDTRASRDSEWTTVTTSALTAGSEAQSGGVFASTSSDQAFAVSYDYLMVVDPSNVSDVQRFLRISEIMYHPVQGDRYEFIEFQNIGDVSLNLNGVSLQAGRPVNAFVFGDVALAIGETTVLAADAETLRQAYDPAIPIAGEWTGGKLSNDGERIEVLDAGGKTILDFSYNDNVEWPEGADGIGKSLEIIDTQQSADRATNWAASAVDGGTPGGFTLKDDIAPVDSDSDGLTDAEELALGTNPNLADSDGDGLSDGLEVTLGTTPTDPTSRFEALLSFGDADPLTLSWPSVAGNRYTVESSVNLLSDSWEEVVTKEADVDSDVTTWSIPQEGESERFYRVRFGD